MFFLRNEGGGMKGHIVLFIGIQPKMVLPTTLCGHEWPGDDRIRSAEKQSLACFPSIPSLI